METERLPPCPSSTLQGGLPVLSKAMARALACASRSPPELNPRFGPIRSIPAEPACTEHPQDSVCSAGPPHPFQPPLLQPGPSWPPQMPGAPLPRNIGYQSRDTGYTVRSFVYHQWAGATKPQEFQRPWEGGETDKKRWEGRKHRAVSGRLIHRSDMTEICSIILDCISLECTRRT